MSFNNNPFLHINLKVKDCKVSIECDSCGAEIPVGVIETLSVQDAYTPWADHIMKSHRRTPSDFEGWE